MPIDDEDRSNPNISHPWGPLCHSPQYPVFNTRGLLSLSLQRFPVSISRHCFKFLKLHGYQGTCHSPAGTIVSGFSPASAEALSSRPARLESTYNYSWILSIRNLAAGDLEGLWNLNISLHSWTVHWHMVWPVLAKYLWILLLTLSRKHIDNVILWFIPLSTFYSFGSLSTIFGSFL